MRQAHLPVIDPVAVDPVVVADQNPAPVVNQRFEGLPGAIGMHHEEAGEAVGHRPQPLDRPSLLPAGLIYMIDRRATDRGPDGFMHRNQRLGDPVDYFLDRTR